MSTQKIIGILVGTASVLGLCATAYTAFSSSAKAQEAPLPSTPMQTQIRSDEIFTSPSPTEPSASGPTAGAGGCTVGASCTTVGETCSRVGGFSSAIFGGVRGPDGHNYPYGYCIQCMGGFAPGSQLTYQVFSGPAC